jgi:hypothetical protein
MRGLVGVAGFIDPDDELDVGPSRTVGAGFVELRQQEVRSPFGKSS